MWPMLIAAAIQAAIEYFQQRKTEEWQNSVSSKLDQIIGQLGEIDAYLHSLPDLFVTALDNETRKIWATEIRARVTDVRDLLNAYPNGPTTDQARESWSRAFDQLKTLIQENTEYQTWGFEQFAVVGVGISAISGLAAHGIEKKLYLSLVDHTVDYYSACLDGSIKGSFENVRQTASTEQAALTTANDLYFNEVWNTGYSQTYTRPHGPGGSRVFTYAVAGSVEGGVGAISHGSVDGHQSVPFMPGTNGPTAEDQGVGRLRTAADRYAVDKDTVAKAQACIDACRAILLQLKQIR